MNSNLTAKEFVDKLVEMMEAVIDNKNSDDVADLIYLDKVKEEFVNWFNEEITITE